MSEKEIAFELDRIYDLCDCLLRNNELHLLETKLQEIVCSTYQPFLWLDKDVLLGWLSATLHIKNSSINRKRLFNLLKSSNRFSEEELKGLE